MINDRSIPGHLSKALADEFVRLVTSPDVLEGAKMSFVTPVGIPIVGPGMGWDFGDEWYGLKRQCVCIGTSSGPRITHYAEHGKKSLEMVFVFSLASMACDVCGKAWERDDGKTILLVSDVSRAEG
jgi:hypothetical protein